MVRFSLLSSLLGWFGLAILAWLPCRTAIAQVVFSEIHYHPVEEPAFNSNGTPAIDLTEDIHEFVEFHNPGAAAVTLDGWKIGGGIEFTFPTNTTLLPGEFLVVARNPERIRSVSAYQPTNFKVLGPYQNRLSNNGETLRLRDAADRLVEAVSYSAQFPWAIGADALGADEEWTGLRNLDYQYTGRSLERVSFSHPANDPANWIASPAPGAPSPGRANSIHRDIPWPVVSQIAIYQDTDEQRLIRANQPARINVAFTSNLGLNPPVIEYFVDNINLSNESQLQIPMTVAGNAANARYSAVLPGQADRSIVRFRILTQRENNTPIPVSPRADDPFAWHAYFVTPIRNSPKPTYDCFISSASLSRLNSNISGSPRRVLAPDPPGQPRPAWNATEPAVFVVDGVVRDIRMRHHGSRYNRNAGRNSFKWFFPRYNKYLDTDAIFETDKGNDFVVGQKLFSNFGLPVSSVRYVDLYLNNNGVLQRLEQGEFDGDLLKSFHQGQQKLIPGSDLEPEGEYYKSVGTIETNGEGPYGRGDGRKLVKPGQWTDLQMYEWTYSQQNNSWRGHTDFKKMIDAHWVARGDTPSNPRANNISALRAYFTNYWDIDNTLNSLALQTWICPWDDTTQNHFLWRRSNGKWNTLPWDCDAWFGRGDNTPATSSIFIGEVGDPNNNFRGPNFFKDSFFKAFREEYKQRLYLLNNTYLHPENITAMGFGSIRSFANARFATVNQKCGYGPFQRPNQPTVLAPANGSSVVPNASLKTADYGHSDSNPSAHTETLWEIRRADGSYQEPEFRLLSKTNLTSLPIPFRDLGFGRTYYWRCTHIDAKQHPSLPSIEAAFTFGAPPNSQTNLVPVVVIDAATKWKYNQGGTNLGPNWIQSNYNDATWPSGSALLAVETAALPETIRTPLTLGPTTFYFRHRFNHTGPAIANWQLRTILDDGAVLYLNGREFYRTRVNGSPPAFNELATENVSDAVQEGPFNITVTNLVIGENVIAVEVHQSATASSDVVMGLDIRSVNITSAVHGVQLNEIFASNQNSATSLGSVPDFVELYNPTDQTVNLTGFGITDNILNPSKYQLPNGTVIPARGFLTIWCDGNTNAPGLHAGFGLDSDGQTVVLLAPGGAGSSSPRVVDSLQYGLQAPHLSVGRELTVSRNWVLNLPTPGEPNRTQPTGNIASVRINEWMAAPESGDDWFELYNIDPLPVALGGHFLTSDLSRPNRSLIPSLSYIGAASTRHFFADENPQQGAHHADFKLRAGGGLVALVASNLSPVDTVNFGPQSSGVSQGRFPDGASRIEFFPETASLGAPNYLPHPKVVINEVLAHSDPPAEDAIELFNVSGTPVDLSGWFLSDDRLNPKKYRFPAGSLLSAGGFRVSYESQFTNPSRTNDFALSSSDGDEVVLSEANANGDLTGYRAVAEFGPSPSGVSIGRIATSTGTDFTLLSQTSFGAEPYTTLEQFQSGTGKANTPPRISPVVISEIHYHPPDFISGGVTNDGSALEYIELYNSSQTSIPLFDPQRPSNTWRLRGGVELDFPTGIIMPPQGVLLLVNFASTNKPALQLFGSVFPISGGATLLGPYSGRLGNGGDRIALQRPDEPRTNSVGQLLAPPYVTVDEIRYGDAAPWPAAADGSGSALQRVDDLSYGNDPVNWRAGKPTPGESRVSKPVDTDADGLPDAWEVANGFDPQKAGEAQLDADNDGATNGQEYLAGTDPRDPASVLRLKLLPTMATGKWILQYTANPGRTHQLEWTDRLTGLWRALGSPRQVFERMVISEEMPPTVDEGYLRIRVF